jgi:hypothetical protein
MKKEITKKEQITKYIGNKNYVEFNEDDEELREKYNPHSTLKNWDLFSIISNAASKIERRRKT